jgi:hypothetical protein
MKTFSHFTNIEKSREEVKKMKRLALLTVCLFLLGTTCVFAQNAAVTTTQTSSLQEHYVYNTKGVAISGTQINTTTLTSTDQDGLTATTTTVTTNQLKSLGGSLKVISAHLVSDSTSTDESTSHTEGDTTYTYNGSGQLESAAGTANTTGNRGNDAEGNPIGTFTSATVETYDVRNGQAIRTQAVTDGTYLGINGEQTGTSRTTTTFDSDIIAGSWQLMSETTVARSDDRQGGWEETTTVKTHQRNGDGVETGLTQTKTGTRLRVTGIDANGNITRVNERLNNYVATAGTDPEDGWTIVDERWTWDQF